MRLRPVLVATLMLMFAVGGAPRAFADAGLVDAHAEVAAALFASSATLAAAQKAADGKLTAAQAKIAVLAAQVKAGDLKHRAELAAAQEAFVAQLADKDRSYAQAIAVFRAGVTDIASTPEGAAALAKFNNGDEAGALDILDRLQSAAEAANQKKTDIQAAVGERDHAALALEARARGKVTTASVIARFEAVTKLDPGVTSDWMNLAQLYADVGRLQDANHAVDAALAAATTQGDKAMALRFLSGLRQRQGDFEGAWTAFSQSFKIYRDLAAASPTDIGAEADFATALAEDVDFLRQDGDYPGARRAAQTSLDFARGFAAANPGNDYIRGFLSSDLAALASAAWDEGDLTAARQALDESLAIARARAAAEPGDSDWLGQVLNELASLKEAQGDLSGAQASFEESLAIHRQISLADPAAQPARRGAAIDLWYVGILRQAAGDQPGAQQALAQSHAIFVQFLATDPSDFSAQENDAFVRFHLAMIAGSGVHFADLSAFYDQAASAGRLSDTDKVLAAEVRRLAASGATPAQGERASAAVEQSIADAELAGGERTFATMSYQAALAAARRLAAGDPHPADLQRVIGQCLSRLAPVRGSGVSWTQAAAQWQAIQQAGALDPADRPLAEEAAAHVSGGPATQAPETYEPQDAAAVRQMAAAEPDDTELQADLWFGLSETGGTLASNGDFAGARKAFEEGLAIARRLCGADPANTGLQHDMSGALNAVGEVRAALGDSAGAGKAYTEALAILRRLEASNPKDIELQHDVVILLGELAALPGSGTTWSDVVAQLETMDRQGALPPADAVLLDEARHNAASSARP
jgi:tetratricopeptide (TPR) repeat protein